MSELDLVPVLGAAALAAALGWLALRQAFASAPAEDRRWREPPPWAWRAAWPAVSGLARLCRAWLPARWRAAGSRQLRQAGLDPALDAEHLVAGSMVAAIAFALIAALLMIAPGWAGPAGVGAGAQEAVSPQRIGLVLVAVGAIGAWWPLSWLRGRRSARLRAIVRALPFCLDLITLSIESGANLTGALQHAVAKGPPGALRVELERVLRDVRAGRGRAEALRAMAERLDLPAVTSWVAALVSAERHGSGLGPILRAQAEQRRQERFLAAEKLAMKAPVKMLLPLLAFIFPCTFVLLFFPVVVRLFEEGLLR